MHSGQRLFLLRFEYVTRTRSRNLEGSREMTWTGASLRSRSGHRDTNQSLKSPFDITSPSSTHAWYAAHRESVIQNSQAIGGTDTPFAQESISLDHRWSPTTRPMSLSSLSSRRRPDTMSRKLVFSGSIGHGTYGIDTCFPPLCYQPKTIRSVLEFELMCERSANTNSRTLRLPPLGDTVWYLPFGRVCPISV